MTSLRQAHDVDLESANCDDGGGGIRHRHVITVGEDGGEAELNDVNDGDKNKPEKTASDSPVEPEAEAGANDIKINVGIPDDRDCRICMLGLDEDIENYGGPLELGCTCKDELAVAHKNCAETWFKMRGTTTCEICGTVAKNVHVVFEPRPANEPWTAGQASVIAPATTSQSRNFYPGRRLVNFVLVLLILLFILCWFFHFKWPAVKTIY